MRIPIDVAEGLQYDLVCYFGGDDYTPMDFGRVGPGCTHDDWQWAVDWIYHLIKTDLLKLWPEGMLDGKGELTFDGPLDFAQELAKQAPSSFEESTEKPVPWIGPHLCLTDKAMSPVYTQLRQKKVTKEKATPTEREFPGKRHCQGAA